MATDVQVDRSGTWEDITYSDFSIEVPTSSIGVAPSATVTTQVRESINPNQPIRIVIDGTTRFEGVTESSGTKRQRGQVRLSAVHAAEALFEERVNLTLTGSTTVVEVLQGALNNANRGGDFSLFYSGSDTTLDSEYEASNRQLSEIFRDMCDRTGRVWWVDPAANEIHVEPVGDRGLWNSLDAQTDGVAVRSFDEGNVKTVRNDVTVNATAGENVTGTATDATSITEYGRRSEKVNISYAATQAEANAYANELLITDPLAQGEIAVPQSVGTVEAPLVNYTVDLTDGPKDIDATGLAIEKQTIEQGRATLKIGEGSGVSLANVNRNAKSRDDENPPGTVMPEDRIGDNSISTQKIVDTAVIESKLDDLVVTLDKIAPDAIDETKITDSAVTTPKLAAGAVIASKIQADTITANEIAAGTITALEIATGTLTANEIDALDIDTGQLTINDDPTNPSSYIYFDVDNGVRMLPFGTGNSIGSDTNVFGGGYFSTLESNLQLPVNGAGTGTIGTSSTEWGSGYFQDLYVNGTAVSPDGGDPSANLDGTVPDHIKDESGRAEVGSLSEWLHQVCTAQQDRIESLENRVTELEQLVRDNA